MKLDLNNLEDSLADFLEKDFALGQIINPVLDKFHFEKKEVIEICHIGKFLLNIDPNIKIIDKPRPPNPDFILNFNGLLIGLEHTRIVDVQKASSYYRIVNLFDIAASDFMTKYPEKHICATFKLKNDNLDFKENEKKYYIQLINNFVLAASNGDFSSQPYFIEKIRIMPNSIVSFSYLENNFTGKELSKEEMQKSIFKKEEKLQKYYSQNDQIQKFWLVLMVGSLSSISFKINDNINYRTDSIFDKVYLMEDFQ